MPDAANLVPSVLLPFVGFALLLFFVAVMIRPSLAGWATTIQKFSGFGVTVEIAAITVILLVSVGLLTVGVWLDLIKSNQNVTAKLDELTQARAKLEEVEGLLKDQLRPIDFKPAVTLEGADRSTRPESLNFEYKLFNGDRRKGPSVQSAMGSGIFVLTFPHIKPTDVVEGIQVTDITTGHVWVYKGSFGVLSPLIPLIELASEAKIGSESGK